MKDVKRINVANLYSKKQENTLASKSCYQTPSSTVTEDEHVMTERLVQ